MNTTLFWKMFSSWVALINRDKPVMRCLIIGMSCWPAFAFLACGGESQHPKTPTAAVQTLFFRIETIKDAGETTSEKVSGEETAKELSDSTADMGALFLNPKRAKLIIAPLFLLDLNDVEFLEEKIDGNTAEVTTEHTVVGFGRSLELRESAQPRRKMTFQLKKEKGRWLISDVGGILQKHST